MPSEKPPKVVLDTNNLVSSIINRKGASSKILDLFRKDRLTIFTSPFQLEELRRVLSYPRIAQKYHLTPAKIKKMVTIIKRLSSIVYPAQTPQIIKLDPDDNQILAIAQEAKVNSIISGDKHLLTLKNWKGIPIVTAKKFLEAYPIRRF